MIATLYHNPRCSKSRQALDILISKNVDINTVLYLDVMISKGHLLQLLKKLDIAPIGLIRRKEKDFERLKLGLPGVTNEKLVDAMVSNPKLIERPIIVVGDKAVIGRPPEKLLEILQ